MKKIAIMQPYFLPYIGYFGLIKHTDEFIIFDSAQFIRHGWIERNRSLKQNGGWLYIKVPLVKHTQHTPIKDILIDRSQPWANKIMAQLVVYKKIAPHYYRVIELVKHIIYQDHQDIVSLNRTGLMAISEYLGIKREFPVFSDMNLKIEQPKEADEWALNICKALGDVTEYWNSPGGEAFFDRSKYDQAGIKLIFQKQVIEPYDQLRETFEPGLSIVDVLMFNSPKETNKMLDNYELT